MGGFEGEFAADEVDDFGFAVHCIFFRFAVSAGFDFCAEHLDGIESACGD